MTTLSNVFRSFRVFVVDENGKEHPAELVTHEEYAYVTITEGWVDDIVVVDPEQPITNANEEAGNAFFVDDAGDENAPPLLFRAYNPVNLFADSED